MFINTEEYLRRITHTLEHVVAPLIESDFGRGQLLSAVFLLDQLTDRIDYKAELIQQEIETGCETIRKIVDAIRISHPGAVATKCSVPPLIPSTPTENGSIRPLPMRLRA